MNRQYLLGVGLAVGLVVALGCRPQQPGYLFEDGDLSHYVGVATQIEYPDVQSCTLPDVSHALPPFTLDNPKPTQYWDLTLEEAVRIALSNSQVLRSLGMVVPTPQPTLGLGTPDTITRMPDVAPTTYDPALRESDARFGVEAALAAFDAQLAASTLWVHGSTPQNSALAFRPPTLIQDQATFQAQLSKFNAAGGTVSLRHDVTYMLDNVPAALKLFPGAYTAELTAEVRQPFLQGAGVAFNRIAGVGSIPGFYNGVMIARIRTDVSLCDFEAAVRNTLSDVERAYWGTYLAYRALHAAVAGRDSALQTWRQVRARYEVGATKGSAADEAQARQQYFTFRGAVEAAQSELYRVESNLRYMLGLASTDGRLIRPADEPTTARVTFDWYEAHAEALVRNVDLRRQKWRVKERELELIAAKNWLLPRLDGVARYRWSGLGPVSYTHLTLPTIYSV